MIEENAEPEIIRILLDEGIIRDEDAPQTETVCEEVPEQEEEITGSEEQTEEGDQPDEEPTEESSCMWTTSLISVCF